MKALIGRAGNLAVAAVILAYWTGFTIDRSWWWTVLAVGYGAALWHCLRTMRKAQRLHEDQTAKLMLVLAKDRDARCDGG